MNLGLFLAIGESFRNMTRSGQDELFKKFYLSFFAKNFSKIYVFSYANERPNGLPKNVVVIPNKYNLHRYLYAVLLPFLNYPLLKQCGIIRSYHLFGTPPAILARILFGKNFVFNYAYDYKKITQIEGQKIQAIFLKFLKPIAVFLATYVFVGNKAILRQIPKSKAIYLPNGVDIKFFRPNRRRSKVRPMILSVGRLEKQKNFENLILAMSGIDVQLTIVGNGSLKAKLQKLARKNGVNLQIIEKIPNTKMPQIYNRADIFVLPSLIEGSPKVLLEAMACGLPVLGTKVDGIKEVINDGVNGFLSDSDYRSLARSLEKILKNPNLASFLGRNARKTMIEKYDLSLLLQKEVKTIKAIL